MKKRKRTLYVTSYSLHLYFNTIIQKNIEGKNIKVSRIEYVSYTTYHVET